MLYHAKNGSIFVDGADMDYISFGNGKENLVMLPGLGDGLSTVKGMAFPFAFMYRIYAKEYKVYVFSRKTACRKGIPQETWPVTRQGQWSPWASLRPAF